jgi:hypothetical protein
MSRKKFSLDRRREDFGLEIQPTVCKCPAIALEGFCSGVSALSVGSSSVVTTPIESRNRASGPGFGVSTMVLSEARGLSLFLVIRGGITCNG